MRPFLHCSTDATCDHLPKRAHISLHAENSSDYYPSVRQQAEGTPLNFNKTTLLQHKKQQHPKDSNKELASDAQSDIQIFPSFSKIKSCVSVSKTSRHSSSISSSSISLINSSQSDISETHNDKPSLCCFHNTFGGNLDLGFKEDKMKYALMRSTDFSVDYKVRIGPPYPRLGGSLNPGASFKKNTESRLTLTLSIGLLLCLAIALTISFHISESLYHDREKHQREIEKASKEMAVGIQHAKEEPEYRAFFQKTTQIQMDIPTVFFSQHHISKVPEGFSNDDFVSWKG